MKPKSHLSQSYTIALFIISAFIFIGAGAHLVYLVPADPRLYKFLAFAEFTLAFLIAVVAVLRARESPAARTATLALNALWLLWVGVGTAIFIWWFGWIRPKERPGTLASEPPRAAPI
jgi:hypothetical protein